MQDIFKIIIDQARQKQPIITDFLLTGETENITTEEKYYIIMILDTLGLVKISEKLQLTLFKAFYKSGYFCYTPLDSEDFKNNYNHIKQDLIIISETINTTSLHKLNQEIQILFEEFYLFEEPVTLKDILI